MTTQVVPPLARRRFCAALVWVAWAVGLLSSISLFAPEPLSAALTWTARSV